jgi:hypothetical protein|nr:MAG TPA: tail assembly chaperone [Caudoviricetes sp.]DAV48296.1 MAG TPA: hypothetical protein [Caudoviricetes sp.]
MESIRVNSGVKVIEVNDKGETISLPLSDDSFIKGFFGLLNETKDKAAAISEKNGDVLETLDAVVEFDKVVRDKIDVLMGENTCKKVFGDVLPSSDQFLDFFAQLRPIVESHVEKRAANMNKYSAERVGSV